MTRHQMEAMTLTHSQEQALVWLRKRGGDGMFDRNGILLAGGETAPHTRTTWNALRDAGYVEQYWPQGRKGRGRLRLTAKAAGEAA
jgi:hypothetical protein